MYHARLTLLAVPKVHEKVKQLLKQLLAVFAADIFNVQLTTFWIIDILGLKKLALIAKSCY